MSLFIVSKCIENSCEKIEKDCDGASHGKVDSWYQGEHNERGELFNIVHHNSLGSVEGSPVLVF